MLQIATGCKLRQVRKSEFGFFFYLLGITELDLEEKVLCFVLLNLRDEKRIAMRQRRLGELFSCSRYTIMRRVAGLLDAQWLNQVRRPGLTALYEPGSRLTRTLNRVRSKKLPAKLKGGVTPLQRQILSMAGYK